METENLTSPVPVIAQDALSIITRTEIDVQIATAKTFPRSLKLFHDKAMSMATLNEEVAALCSYSLPRDGKVLEGASVRLAEIVCSAYGNIRAGARVIANDGKSITAQGVCHDLENNNCSTVEVRKKITYKNGKTFNEDMQIVTGNAACAIAYRNAVFKIIPAALISDIYAATKEVARGTADTLVVRRDKAVKYFATLGVTEMQLCEVLNVQRVADIDIDKLSILTGIRALISNGESTVADIFSKQEIQQEDLQLLYDMKKEALTPEERKNAERILNSGEKSSFKKLFNSLKSK